MRRESMIAAIADLVVRSMSSDKPLLVGIDGVDCAGKTTFADELRDELQRRDVPVVRASIDGFHRPRAERLARGSLSPEGYYRDSFDYPALIEEFLEPVKRSTSTTSVATALYDWTIEEPRRARVEVSPDSVVLFEGVFLFRPEIDRFWDFRIFLDIPLITSLDRGVIRDARHFGGTEGARERYTKRYIPGQEIYLGEVDPRSRADVIIHNEDPRAPGFSVAGNEAHAPTHEGEWM